MMLGAECMRSVNEIESLLDQLEHCIADDLESQYLDFKEWKKRSFDDSVKQIIKMSVCMANGGGGHIVFGVADKVQGRKNAIRGVPNDLDLYDLQNRVYTKTDPHLLPTLQLISVSEGTGVLLVVSVTGEMAPYTTTDGSATIERQIPLDDEAAKIRILTVLKEQNLTNQEIRRMTGWDRKKVHRTIKELESSGVKIVGKGRGSKYRLDIDAKSKGNNQNI